MIFEVRQKFHSHAGGMAVSRPYSFEIDFLGNPTSGSASWFFVIILKLIFSSIFEIKIHAKKFLDTKKISFQIKFLSSIFINQHISDPANVGVNLNAFLPIVSKFPCNEDNV